LKTKEGFLKPWFFWLFLFFAVILNKLFAKGTGNV